MSVPGGATAEGGDFDAELQDLLSRYNKSLGDLKEESPEAGAMGPAGVPDKLRQRKLKPPGLLELLQEVRVEEGAEAARSVRRQQSKPTKRVQACRVTAPDESNRKIEEELTNLKAQLAAIQAPPPPMDTPVVTTPETAHLVAELERLRKELSQLKNNSLGRSPKPPFKGKIICYRCGEPGHMVRECQRPPNAELVQRRLLERSQRPSGNEGRASPQGQRGAPSVNILSHSHSGSVSTSGIPTVSAPKQLPFDLKDSPITTEWKQRFIDVLTRHQNAFSNDDLDIGCTSAVKHQIRLTDDPLFDRRAEGFPQQILRIKETHTGPADEGYHPDGRSRQTRPFFWCPLGFYEFNRMPQGICNAPATFQRLMEKCMGDMAFTDVLVYLDDLLVFSRTLEEHVQKLDKVLTRLEEFGLRLNPDKCQFVHPSVKCLGHVISAGGVQTDPDKISAVTTWPRPQNTQAPVDSERLITSRTTEATTSAYASRGLSKSDEANYPAHKLEFLALKWAVTDKFSDYLYAKLDATGHRWLAALATFDFDIKYKPGKQNQDADGLSRRPQEPPPDDDEYIEFQRQANVCGRSSSTSQWRHTSKQRLTSSTAVLRQ
ncbi:hypothetical protein BSL78_14884 [Apostichopus japonicus]|uniref:CCHC-type domain-containing protein n=1 Tax=Stichopus japonicus TaxID=307972 RepID=A0A2G8KJV2_STIJA|nr:hypothetical protein BSL78_14884 [Apostichopus japonicus]